MKRALDLVGSVSGLLLLSPLLLAIAVLIWLESGRPIFFLQERVGRHGRPFRIIKFRTMAVGSEAAGPAITIGCDSRITRTGASLRRRKLDELPQLVNVLLGTMSLVGPRPEVPRYLQHYPPAARQKILSVRPGMTDLASLEFIDEAAVLERAEDGEHAYVTHVLPAKLTLAMEYVDNRSTAYDLRIVCRTLARLIGSDSTARL